MAQLTLFVPGPTEAYAEFVFGLYESAPVGVALDMLRTGHVNPTREAAQEYITSVHNGEGDVYEFSQEMPEVLASLASSLGLTVSE